MGEEDRGRLCRGDRCVCDCIPGLSQVDRNSGHLGARHPPAPSHERNSSGRHSVSARRGSGHGVRSAHCHPHLSRSLGSGFRIRLVGYITMEKISRSTGRWEPQMSRPSNNAMHQTRRGGAVASRPVVEARLAGDCECSLYQARSPIEITTARIGWTRQS